jgi:hypothetical protein
VDQRGAESEGEGDERKAPSAFDDIFGLQQRARKGSSRDEDGSGFQPRAKRNMA